MSFDPLCGEGAAHALREALLAAAVIRGAAKGYSVEKLLAHYRRDSCKGFCGISRCACLSTNAVAVVSSGKRRQQRSRVASHGWNLVCKTRPRRAIVLPATSWSRSPAERNSRRQSLVRLSCHEVSGGHPPPWVLRACCVDAKIL